GAAPGLGLGPYVLSDLEPCQPYAVTLGGREVYACGRGATWAVGEFHLRWRLLLGALASGAVGGFILVLAAVGAIGRPPAAGPGARPQPVPRADTRQLMLTGAALVGAGLLLVGYLLFEFETTVLRSSGSGYTGYWRYVVASRLLVAVRAFGVVGGVVLLLVGARRFARGWTSPRLRVAPAPLPPPPRPVPPADPGRPFFLTDQTPRYPNPPAGTDR